MKCPSCNAELPASAKFCGACGSTLAAPPPEPSWAPPPQQGQQGQAWPPPEQAWNAIPPPEQQWNPPSPGQPPPYGTPVPAAPVPYGGTLPPVEKRFKALRMIATMLKVFAFVVAGICVILALVSLVGGAATSTSSSNLDIGPAAFFSGFVGALLLLIYGAFMFIFLYAYAEVIYLFLSIEENTRVTNEVLRTR